MLYFVKMCIPEGEEWQAQIEKSKSPGELSAWTKFWDAMSKLDKGTGVIDVGRARFVLSLLLMMQPEVSDTHVQSSRPSSLAQPSTRVPPLHPVTQRTRPELCAPSARTQVLTKCAKMEEKNKNGLYGRLAPVVFNKDPFDFSQIKNARYRDVLREAFKAKREGLVGALQEKGMKLLLASWTALEYPPTKVRRYACGGGACSHRSPCPPPTNTEPQPPARRVSP